MERVIKNYYTVKKVKSMPLQIVREDITKMQVDAIVNSTNIMLIGAGNGVDGCIHAAAGPELQKKLYAIGKCAPGDAVVTEACGNLKCKYIIHAVGPVYRGGLFREKRLLKRCYKRILELAQQYNCESIAMPILSAGFHGYPKKEAYQMATSVIREYLAENESDIMIYIVIFDEEIVQASRDAQDVCAHYTVESESIHHETTIIEDFDAEDEDFFFDDIDYEDELEKPCVSFTPEYEASVNQIKYSLNVCGELPDNFPKSEKDKDYAMQDRSFASMCEWWMEQKDINISKFYADSNISKGTFWNIKKHPDKTPKKTTAYACVIGLKLGIEEANDLLMRAGLTFSDYFETDRIVKSYIKNEDFDIDKINWELFDKDLQLLGSNA